VRRVLQLFGISALRSRLGVAVVLVIVIFAVVGVARAVSGPGDGSVGTFPPALAPTGTASGAPAAGDDGIAEPEPQTTTAVDPGPSLSAGAAKPESVAEAFANSWLDRRAKAQAWFAALLPHSTPELAAKLKGVDPVVVPAERLTGPATVVPRGIGLAEVSYPVDSGTLVLRMVVAKGRWLVDGVDWERA